MKTYLSKVFFILSMSGGLFFGCSEEKEEPVFEGQKVNAVKNILYGPSEVLAEEKLTLYEPHVSISHTGSGHHHKFNVLVIVEKETNLFYQQDEDEYISFNLTFNEDESWKAVKTSSRIPIIINNEEYEIVSFSIIPPHANENPKLKLSFINPSGRVAHADGTVHLPHDPT